MEQVKEFIAGGLGLAFVLFWSIGGLVGFIWSVTEANVFGALVSIFTPIGGPIMFLYYLFGG